MICLTAAGASTGAAAWPLGNSLARGPGVSGTPPRDIPEHAAGHSADVPARAAVFGRGHEPPLSGWTERNRAGAGGRVRATVVAGAAGRHDQQGDQADPESDYDKPAEDAERRDCRARRSALA